MKIKILIADDHAIVRYGLASLIATQSDMEVVGQAKNGKEVVALALGTRPDIAIMDLAMPKMDGAEATAVLHEKLPETKVVILTSFVASDGIAHALDNGAAGAIMKTTDDSEILPALRRIAAGERIISPDIKKQLAANPPVPRLSPRQHEILDAIARGLTNKEIAMQLGIRKDGVEKHVKVLLAKVGAANRTEAAAIALRKGILNAQA